MNKKGAKASREEMDLLATQLLRKFCSTTIRAFIDVAGEKKLQGAALPYLKPFGMSEALEIGRLGKVDSGSIEEQLKTISLSMKILDIKHRPMELKKDGGCIDVTDCPTKGMPRVICALHEEVAKGMIAAKHQELDLKNLGTREGERKTCRWLIFDKSKGQELVLAQKTVSEIDPPDLDEEDRLDRSMMALTEIWVIVLDAMTEVLGAEKAELVLAPRFRAVGASFVPRLQEMSGISTPDLQGIARTVDMFNQVMYQEGDLMQTCDGLPVKVMSSCPFSGISDLACALLENVVKGICQELDENTDCRFVKFECHNNVVCHWVVVKRPKPSWPLKDEGKGRTN
jgi:hypothetical protein